MDIKLIEFFETYQKNVPGWFTNPWFRWSQAFRGDLRKRTFFLVFPEKKKKKHFFHHLSSSLVPHLQLYVWPTSVPRINWRKFLFGFCTHKPRWVICLAGQPPPVLTEWVLVVGGVELFLLVGVCGTSTSTLTSLKSSKRESQKIQKQGSHHPSYFVSFSPSPWP